MASIMKEGYIQHLAINRQILLKKIFCLKSKLKTNGLIKYLSKRNEIPRHPGGFYLWLAFLCELCYTCKKVCYNSKCMNPKIQKVIDEIKNICLDNRVSHLYLFGSYAKGTELNGSDIDVVVKGVPNYRKLKEEIDNIRTLKIINIFNYDKISNKYLIEDIDKYGKIIY